MRVKWNRNLDGSQAQQNSEENATDSAQEKGAVPDRPPAGGFLKIFRLKRHKKPKHGKLPDGRQHSTDDSSESCRPVDDNRSELAVLPSDDDAARSVCGDSGQYPCETGLLRSVSVSQSRRGSEDYSDLKYRSLPSVGKGWFSFASRKSWLNLSSRGRRGSKDEKKISASSQSIPAKSLRKTEKLIEEKLLRESPEKCYSENPFPTEDNRILNVPLRKEQKGSLRSRDESSALSLSNCNQADAGVVVQNNDLQHSKTEVSKFAASEESDCMVSSPDDSNKNAPGEIFIKSKLPVPQCVGKKDDTVLNRNAEISTDKKNNPDENHHLGTVPKKIPIRDYFSSEKNVAVQNLKSLPHFVCTERCQKPGGDSQPKDCDPLPCIAGNHHSSGRREQDVTNDTPFHSVARASEEDAVLFPNSSDRSSVCQTENEQVTVERSGEGDHSLPRRDNGEKNQQRNGIPTLLLTTGFESSTGQMKSLGSGTNTEDASWPAEVTHRIAAFPDTSKNGRDVLSSEHNIPNSAMFSSSAELVNCTKWYVPICDIRQKTDNDNSCAVVIPPKFQDEVNSSQKQAICESNEPSSGGNKAYVEHGFNDQHSENSNLFINITSDRTSHQSAESSHEEKEVLSCDLTTAKQRAQEDSEKQTLRLRFSENPVDSSESEYQKSCDSNIQQFSGVFCDRLNSDVQIPLDNISLDIRDMNQRNINFSHSENRLQMEKSAQVISDENPCTNNQFLFVIANGNSCASKDHNESITNLRTVPRDSEFVTSADKTISDPEEKSDVPHNNSGVMNNTPPETLGKETPSLTSYDVEKFYDDVKNHFDDSSSFSSSNCLHLESTPKDRLDKNDSKLSDYDLAETEEVIKQVEDMISASFKSCCHETFERKIHCEKKSPVSDLKSKVRKLPLCKDVFEDILQKSVSSDSGISEEIQEICLEEVKYGNHQEEERLSSACHEGESTLKSLRPFLNLEEAGKDKTIPRLLSGEFRMDPMQLQGQGNHEENEGHSEKHTVQNNYYSEQHTVFDLSNESHARAVTVNNHSQGDVQMCSAQMDNSVSEIDNSLPEIDSGSTETDRGVQNESFKKGTKSCNREIPEGVIEQVINITSQLLKPSAVKFPTNFPDENVTPSPKLPFCSDETQLPLEEKLLPSFSETERFYENTFCNLDGFCCENFQNQVVRIYTLTHCDSRETHGCLLRGDRTSHVIDIFSSDCTPTYIFCSECYCCDVLYSSVCPYLLPYSMHYQGTSFPTSFVKYRAFNSLIWKITDFCPHLKFDGQVNNRTTECIPFLYSTNYPFCTSAEVTAGDVPQKNIALDLSPKLNTSLTLGVTPSPEAVVDAPTADKDTRCEPVLSCELETSDAGCAVELKSTNSTTVPSEHKLDDSNDPTIATVQLHPPKLTKKPSADKTDSSSKDRIVLRKSRIPRSKHGSVRVLHHPSPKPVRPPMWLSRAELSQEIQHLGTLCEARTKELNLLKMKLKHATLGFDAFAAVFKYLTEDLDALSHPQLVKELTKTQKLLHQAKNDIICYEKQIEELKTHHAKELAELSEKMLHVYQSELQQVTNKQSEELSLLEEQHQKKMVSLQTSYVEAAGKVKAGHKKEVEEIRQKFLKQKEEAELLHQSEMKHLEESHLEVQKSLQAEIEQLKVQYAESKQQSRNIEETLQKDTDTKLQWVSSKKAELDKEVDSLKAVLEMKNNEVHSLRKENLEMQKELEELPVAKEKIKMLQARAEDLQALMAEKVRVERQLSTEHQTMKEIYERESKMNKRLSMENEELQWRLKQASELSLLLRSQSNSPDVLETPSPPKSPWQQQPPQQQNSRSKFFTYVDPSECGPESPQAKSPAPVTASRSKFFTFVDPSEYDSQSPHSPRYKRVTPSLTSSPCKQPPPLKNPAKLPLASTPRKSKVSSEVQSGGGTPRKVSKKQGGKTSPVYPLPKTGDEEASDTCNVANNIPESMESSISSEDSSLPSRDLEDPMAHICTSTKEPLDDKTVTFESLGYDTSPKPESDVSILGEATDPKKYYHMTFPVLKETGPDCDVDDGSSYLVLENNENCFVTAKEIGDPSDNITRNGYANPDDVTSSQLDDVHTDVKVSDSASEGFVSHKMDPGVSEMVITSSPCENLSMRDGSNSQDVITMHIHSALVNDDSKTISDAADT